MIRQEVIYVSILLFSALVTTSMAIYGLRRRQLSTAITFSLMMFNITIWLVGYALELYSTELDDMLFWIKFSYIGVMSAPTLWLIFALQYTGHERWLTPRNIALLFIFPVFIIFINWTNEHHRLFYSNFYVDLTGPFPRFALERGPLYLVGTINSYLTLVTAMVFLVIKFISASRTYRRQISIIIVGALFPWIANILYITGLNPFPYLNLTPLSFVATGTLMAWGLFRHQLLDVLPIARDKVVENMRDGVIVLNEQARIVDLNPPAQALVEHIRTDLIGVSLSDIPVESLRTLAQSLGPTEIQMPLTFNQANTLHYYDALISPLHGRKGALTGWVIVLHNMTERRRAEQALQLRTEELETRNAELDAFAHTVAHDLKSPLTIMTGFSMLLETRYEDMDKIAVMENLHRLSTTGRKMSNIIDELLLLASVRKMNDLELTPLDMGTILAEVQERLKDTFIKHKASVSLPKTWPTAIGYAPWIEEVWLNYVSNALKYGGEPQIDIAPHLEFGADILPEQSQARFWVKDNGPGLTNEEKSQLFTQFTRLHKVRAQGHGLGLSIVQRIVDRLGGDVGANSTLGQGSVFWFTLPMMKKLTEEENILVNNE